MSDFIAENAGHLTQKLATLLSYATGAGLLLGDAINFLNDNAGAIGALLGIATFSTNFYFQYKRSKGEG